MGSTISCTVSNIFLACCGKKNGPNQLTTTLNRRILTFGSALRSGCEEFCGRSHKKGNRGSKASVSEMPVRIERILTNSSHGISSSRSR